MVDKLQGFQHLQMQLANEIRNPSNRTNNFELRRLEVYQSLFYNNVESFCSTAFPVLKSLMPEGQWQAIVRQFFIEHQCDTPHFIEISQEFLAYLSTHAELLPEPYMIYLAHYEWVELDVSVQDSPCQPEFMQTDTSIKTNPLTLKDPQFLFYLSAPSYPLAYPYPVQTISAAMVAKQPVEQHPTHLIVYLNSQQQVGFIEADATSVYLLNHLLEEHLTWPQLIQCLTSEPLSLEPEQAEQFLQQAMPAWIDKNIVLVESVDN